MDNLNLNILETFFEVYKVGSYTKASKTLGRTVTGVANHIQKLELIRGKKLFIKEGMSLRPTDEANVIYQSLYQHFHSFELALRSFNGTNEKAHFEIITSTGASLLWLISELKKFTEKNQSFRYRIHTTEEPTITEPYLYDIIALPQNKKYQGYKMLHVATFCSRLYVSKEYANQYGIPASLEDLDKHRLISFYNRSEMNRGDPDWHLRVGRPASDPREPFMCINNAMGVGKAVALGIGIAALTDNNPYIEESSLIPVLPELSSPPSKLYISYNVLLSNSDLIKEFEKK